MAKHRDKCYSCVTSLPVGKLLSHVGLDLDLSTFDIQDIQLRTQKLPRGGGVRNIKYKQPPTVAIFMVIF